MLCLVHLIELAIVNPLVRHPYFCTLADMAVDLQSTFEGWGPSKVSLKVP